MLTNRDRFINAANWALERDRQGLDHGINIRRFSTDAPGRNATLLNVSKGLMYSGYKYPEQEVLKGLIVSEDVSSGTAEEVVAACFPKFFNMGEPAEQNQYQTYLARSQNIIFWQKADGVNIRPWLEAATKTVHFATRGMLFGKTDEDMENSFCDFGALAREIAEEKYPAIFEHGANGHFTERYSCIFEMIHPDCQIITNYGDRRDLVLLTVFDLKSGCRELTHDELIIFARQYNFNLVPIWTVAETKDFDETLLRLEAEWVSTDHEGTVAAFVDEAGQPVYRLKIKNRYYLDLLRIARFCTFKNTREMIEQISGDTIATWEAFRDRLYVFSSMNEELEMGYRTHWDAYWKWQSDLTERKLALNRRYESLPRYESQKDFALHVIKDRDTSPFFFAMRQSESKGVPLKDFWTNNKKMQALMEKMYPAQAMVEEEVEAVAS